MRVKELCLINQKKIKTRDIAEDHFTDDNDDDKM